MAKVLIVDDDAINSNLLAKRLKKRGFEVDVVHSGVDCLEYLKVNHRCIVLLDLVMPGMDGLDVLKEIRILWQQVEVPVIMLSADDSVDKVVDCLNYQASDYIIKPANIHIACARINLQLDLQKLYFDSMKKKELAAINSMVITFNHEINNPLTVAMSVLSKKVSALDEEKVAKGLRAVKKIRDIVRKIDEVSQGASLEEEDYIDNIKMIKIK